MRWLKQYIAIYVVGMMTSVLCSELVIWAVQHTTSERQPEKDVQPPQGTWALTGGPRTSKGVWLLDGSFCGETWGDQAGRASLPLAPVPLPTEGSELCRFADVWSWCCDPWTPARPGHGDFAPALSSQRAQDCPWNHFSSVWLLRRPN